MASLPSFSSRELVPALSVPMLRTCCLARLTAFYRDAVGFELAQQVPGVVSVLRHGALRLQLWQHAHGQGGCRIPLDAPQACIFRLHAALARRARALLREPSPQLRPWGAWEFSLTDIEGHQLLFAQWAAGSAVRAAPGAPDLRFRPRA